MPIFKEVNVVGKCWHYDAIDKTDKVTCINCHHWGWTKCEDEVLLMNRINETEQLMRQSSYYRGKGGALRQK